LVEKVFGGVPDREFRDAEEVLGGKKVRGGGSHIVLVYSLVVQIWALTEFEAFL